MGVHWGIEAFPEPADQDVQYIDSRRIVAPVPSVDFLLPPEYTEYEVRLVGVVPATDAVSLILRMSSDTGANFDAGAADYSGARHLVDAVVSHVVNGGDASGILLSIAGDLSNDARGGYHGVVGVYLPALSTNFKQVRFSACYARTGANLDEATIHGSGRRKGVTPKIDAIRFVMGAGDIAAGEFTLNGVRKQ